MKERGAQFNGSTGLDRTNYYETLPATDDNLEFAIKLEADRMVNSSIKAEDLATEFSVVRNEFECGENSPERVLIAADDGPVAYEWHNYGKSTIGNRSDIERVPIDSLRAFYKKYYQPDNAMLVVAGKFDEKKALAYIAKYFGSIPKPDRKLPATYTEEPAQDGERHRDLRRVGDVGLVGLVYHVPAASHADFPALQMLAEHPRFASPRAGLYKALVETKKASERYGLRRRAATTRALFEIIAEVNTKDLAELEKVRDVDALGTIDDVAQERRDRRKRSNAPSGSYLKDRELAAADPNRIAVRAQRMGRRRATGGSTSSTATAIEKVTPAEVKEVAAKYLTPSNRTVGFFLPTAQARADARSPPTPDIAKLVEGYKGREVKSDSAESFDVVAAGHRGPRAAARSRSRGSSSRFLPKKTRGESVHIRLTLRYGDAENLKGSGRRRGLPARAYDPGHEAPRPGSRSRTRSTRTSPGWVPAWAVRRARGGGAADWAR